MRGYTVKFYLEGQQVNLKDLIKELKIADVDVDAVIVKTKTGWTSPKQHLILSLRKKEGQIINVGKVMSIAHLYQLIPTY